MRGRTILPDSFSACMRIISRSCREEIPLEIFKYPVMRSNHGASPRYNHPLASTATTRAPETNENMLKALHLQFWSGGGRCRVQIPPSSTQSPLVKNDT